MAQTCLEGLQLIPTWLRKAADLHNRSALRFLGPPRGPVEASGEIVEFANPSQSPLLRNARELQRRLDLLHCVAKARNLPSRPFLYAPD